MFLTLLSLFSILLLNLNISLSNTQSICKDAPFPYKYSSDAVCSSPRIMKSTLPTFPTTLLAGTKDMTVDAEFKILQACQPASDNIELFGLTIDKQDGTVLPLMRHFYLRSNNSFNVYGGFSDSGKILKSVGAIMSAGDPLHFFMKMSLNTGITNARGIMAAPGVFSTVVGTLPLLTPTMTFDSTTKFFFCTDISQVPHAYCEVVGFAIWYAFESASNGFSYVSGLYPTPIAFYEFNQGSGHVVPDSYNNLGNAYLGASTATTADPATSPVWNSADNNRMQFTSSSQYVTLPNFPISRYNALLYSLSVSCWIKISASSYGYIFKYAGSNGATKFGIQLNSDRKIWGKIGLKTNGLNSRTVPPDTWTLITVFITHSPSDYTSYIAAYIGTLVQGTFSDEILTLTSTAADDIVTIGPFSNPPVSIYNMKIFSPGAFSPDTTSPCFTPTSFCDISMGPANKQNCITCKSGYYIKNFICYPECFTYSDGSCQPQCSYPYVRRNETYMAYCDFRCDSNNYLYPDGSCLSTCNPPSVKYQNLTDEWYCKGPCADSKGLYYPDQKVCLVSCSDGYEEDNSLFYKRCIPVKTSETVKTTIEVGGKAGTASRAVTQATAALSSGSPTGISASVAGKIFTNIKYLNISYSVELLDALETWGSSFISLGFLPDLPVGIEAKIAKRPVPYMFEKYHVGSSFLLNFWNYFCLLIILTTAFICVIMLEFFLGKCLARLNSIQPKLAVLRAMIQNFILTQLYSFYGDIVFYSTLEYRSLDFSLGLTGLSFSLSIVFLAIMLICFGLHLFLIKKYQRIKKRADKNLLNQFVNSHKGNFVLFKDFKDTLIIQQAFLFFLTARDLAFSLILTTMFLHPLAQTVLILVLNLAMVAYLVLYRPFDSLFDASQQLFYEVITLSVNVSVLIMAIMDAIHSNGYQLRKELGKFLIVMNMIFNFGALAWMLIKGYMVSKEIFESYKAKKKQQRKPKLSDLPLQKRHLGSFDSEASLKAKQNTGLENSFSNLFDGKQDEISYAHAATPVINLEESTIETGWENANAKKIMRTGPKRSKIKRKLQN